MKKGWMLSLAIAVTAIVMAGCGSQEVEVDFPPEEPATGHHIPGMGPDPSETPPETD